MNWLYPFLLFLSLSLRPFSRKNLTFSYPPFRTFSSQISFHFLPFLNSLLHFLFISCPHPITSSSPYSFPPTSHLLSYLPIRSFPYLPYINLALPSLPITKPLLLSLTFLPPYSSHPAPPIIEEGRGQYITFIIVY